MTGPEVLDLARSAVWAMILIAGPTMVIGLLVGVIIALFQALTQIQEMTLVFVPKILAIFVTLLLSLPFMSQVLEGFMGEIAEMILATGPV
ncbi:MULTISPECIES: flagellar biosynthesis protein FliQ [Stappiaceae]|jgi:flagellar biosynthetic protein FliQ|uniref:flagellar biosynthesis protein FliQ n=1 Tax=Stappiaceae TaxID=2821832 RepID=UPI0009277F40|nr:MULTISPECIES: flagellar biosynthesis protein FliQ [Stappiaceae]MBO9419878.1 flagellar biosynthesis protein FliQ [Labrenzia sp. R4_2]MBO9425252.1 flagellar biosynthesis protein FliQ [Labrenzia sp. R4_1]OJJ11086.1 flagellar biosynthetic protein FliQ [Alphaproteobacteria bacterium AO1-B]